MKELVIRIGENTYNSLVEFDGKPIGFIQNIKVEMDATKSTPDVTITFPDLRPYEALQAKDAIMENVAPLSQISGINIVFRELTPVTNEIKDVPAKEWASSELPDDPADLSKWDEILNKKE